MSSKRVAVLMGGWGEEQEISNKTGEAVVRALESRGHRVTRVMAGPGLDVALRGAEVEVAFLALHGRMGEDGRVQGLLEVMGLPYTGSGVLASALAMNKPFAKRLFRHHNLPIAQGYALRAESLARLDALHGDLGFPVMVKPSCGGSSVGLAQVEDRAQLAPAVAEACRFGGEALVERFVRGREVTVGILGDQVLGSCEIAHGGRVFDYRSKYGGGSRYFLPPRLGQARISALESLGLAAHRALGCRGYSRVDLLAAEAGEDVLLEVNTLPGMTQHSLLPKIARKAGFSFEDLCERILLTACLDAGRQDDALFQLAA
ncbi:MAG: D-alanine--D-alanine ligase [Myxococcota bacterium]|nr:D-alanine--D-alanine ligase [Myxococcota bacterium]